ncbi:MAG: 3-hydroxyacyl-CoA dehydrogenase NAD-binding domain-containing protein [Cytophagales bacterium]|nr:3-hydroxyacyl-CoA dehydrogenase NAD-binding domain-containing protein [Cytophagales bacterium]
MILSLKDIKKVLILGCGTLGTRVGLRFALSGYLVKMYDIDEKIFISAQKTQDQLLQYLVKNNLLAPQHVDKVTDRISWTLSPEEAAYDADLINESVTEDVEVKLRVWKQFGALSPEHTIFTTNTSYLLPSMFAEISGRPERFCAYHFHDVFYARVVDIMPHANTEKWVVDLLIQLGPVLDQIPVYIEKESPGYIFNYMLMSVLGSAGALLTNGTGSVEAIDKSWMGNLKTEIGPFGILDAVGLDTAWHVVKKYKDDKSKRFAILLKQMIEKGKLGVKSGEGFYHYPNPRFKEPDFLGDKPCEEL